MKRVLMASILACAWAVVTAVVAAGVADQKPPASQPRTATSPATTETVSDLVGTWRLKTAKSTIESVYAPDGTYTCTVRTAGAEKVTRGTYVQDGDQIVVNLASGKVSVLQWEVTDGNRLELTDVDDNVSRMTRVVVAGPADIGTPEMATPAWWIDQAVQKGAQSGKANLSMQALCVGASQLGAIGRVEEARKLIQKVDPNEPGRVVALGGIARGLVLAKDNAGAVAAIEGIADAEARSDAFSGLASSQTEVGQFEAARASILKITGWGTRADAYTSLAAAQAAAGDAKGAAETVKLLRSAAARMTEKKQATLKATLLAMGAATTGDLKAVGAELGAINDDEERVSCFAEVSDLLRGMGRKDLAARLLGTAEGVAAAMDNEKHRRDFAYKSLLKAYAALGEVKAAQRLLEEIEEPILRNVGLQYIAQAQADSDLVAAEASAEKINALEIGEVAKARAYLAIAAARARQGDSAGALSALDSAWVQFLALKFAGRKNDNSVFDVFREYMTTAVTAGFPGNAKAKIDAEDADPEYRVVMYMVVSKGLIDKQDADRKARAATTKPK